MNNFLQFLIKKFIAVRKQTLKLFGYKYIVNYTSHEIHVVSNMKTNCHQELMTNAKYVKSSQDLLENGYDGCRWCYDEANHE